VETTVANLHGGSFADMACQEEAEGAEFTGTFFAWLSTPDYSPQTRFYHSPGPYVRPDGVVIADNWNDLVDGNLKNPLNRDVSGRGTNQVYVRTGTDADGTVTDGGETCEGWTVNYFNTPHVVGDPTKTDDGWTNATTQPCQYLFGFYCFQQNSG
jgi:hypothetical protein